MKSLKSLLADRGLDDEWTLCAYKALVDQDLDNSEQSIELNKESALNTYGARKEITIKSNPSFSHHLAGILERLEKMDIESIKIHSIFYNDLNEKKSLLVFTTLGMDQVIGVLPVNIRS
jgi:hypothetical protein